VTWDEALSQWVLYLRSSGASALTIRQRRWQLSTLAAKYPESGPFDLAAADLLGWLAGRPDWSAETLKSMRACARSFYGWAVDAGHITVDPAARLPRVRVPRAVPRPASDAAVDRALAGANDRDTLLILSGALAGLRAAEIAGLRWDAIEDGVLRVRGKGGHARLVPAHPDLAVALAEERARREQGRVGSGFYYARDTLATFVFTGTKGRHMHPSWVSHLVSQLLGDATAHQLRHRFASRAYSAERDLRAVQELLGHQSPMTTAVYTAASDASLERAVLAAGGR
jgi:integrase/recombinase XerC